MAALTAAGVGLSAGSGSPASAQTPGAGGGSRGIDGQLPSFLGADMLRALESAGSARAKAPAAPAAAAVPAAASPSPSPQSLTQQEAPTPAATEPMAAAEAQARARADERVRQLSGGKPAAAPAETAATSAALAPSPAPVKDAAPSAPPAAQAPTSAPTPAGKPSSPSGKPAQRVGDCGAAKITAEAVPAGRVRISIAAPCQKAKVMRLVYGAYTFERPLDAEGEAVFLVDLFQGAGEAIVIALADGEPQQVNLPATDLERVSKVAIAWTAPVNLDLHAYAYAADERDTGHVWAEAPSSPDAALTAASGGQGRGFLSSADDGRAEGTKVEVYTFVHGSDDAPGTITMALDYQSRGATPAGDSCGTGKLATVPFDIIVVERGRITARESALLGAAPCGVALAAAARYARSAVPELRIRK